MLLSPADVPNNDAPDNDNDNNAMLVLFDEQSHFALLHAITQSSAGVDGVLGGKQLKKNEWFADVFFLDPRSLPTWPATLQGNAIIKNICFSSLLCAKNSKKFPIGSET